MQPTTNPVAVNPFAQYEAYFTPVCDKRPTRKAWQRERLTWEEATRMPGNGVGLLTGTVSSGIIAIDFDGEEAGKKWVELFGLPLPTDTLDTVIFTSGKPGRFQALYIIDPAYWPSIKTKKVTAAEGQMLEFRWTGCQSVVPPSFHPETEGYTWLVSPEEIGEIAPLPQVVLEWLRITPKTSIPTKQIKLPTNMSSAVRATTSIKKALKLVPSLEIFIPKSQRRISFGTNEGNRNDSAFALACSLIANAEKLDEMGIPYQGSAQDLFYEFCNRCSPPIGQGPKDSQNEQQTIWDSAMKAPRNGLTEEQLENCYAAFIFNTSEGKKRVVKDADLGEYEIVGVREMVEESAQVVGNVSPGKPPAASIVSQFLVDKYQDCLAWDELTNSWMMYEKNTPGVWGKASPMVVSKLVDKFLREKNWHFSQDYVGSVTSLMKIELLTEQPWNLNNEYVALKNGVLNIKTRELMTHNPEFRRTWSLPYNYNPAAECLSIKNWLLEMTGDPAVAHVLRCYLAAIVHQRTDLQKFLEITGPGGTGKSTYIKLAQALIGITNSHATTLKKLEENQFETASLYDKRLVTISDSQRYAGSMEILKSLVGGDLLPFEQKGIQSSAGFYPEAMVIIACNERIQSPDTSSGLQRRRINVVMNKTVAPDKMKDLLTDSRGELSGEFAAELPGLLNWVLELDQDEITKTLKHSKSAMMATFELESLTATNPLADWLDAQVKLDSSSKVNVGRNLEERAMCWLYPNYVYWLTQANPGSKPLSVKRFVQNLEDLVQNQLKIPNVKKIRTYEGSQFTGLALKQLDENTPGVVQSLMDLKTPKKAKKISEKNLVQISTVPNGSKVRYRGIEGYDFWVIEQPEGDAILIPVSDTNPITGKALRPIRPTSSELVFVLHYYQADKDGDLNTNTTAQLEYAPADSVEYPDFATPTQLALFDDTETE